MNKRDKFYVIRSFIKNESNVIKDSDPPKNI